MKKNRSAPYVPPDFSQVAASLRAQGFAVTERGGGARIERDGCAAEISPAQGKNQDVRVTARPGVLLGGEIATLLDKGFQKFFKTAKLEVPATAEKLKALHTFEAALADAVGCDQSYNEALGTVSDSYLYDRVKGRADARP